MGCSFAPPGSIVPLEYIDLMVCQGPGPTLSGSRLQPKISLESGTGQQLNAQASSYLPGLSAWNRRVFGQAEIIAIAQPKPPTCPHSPPSLFLAPPPRTKSQPPLQ